MINLSEEGTLKARILNARSPAPVGQIMNTKSCSSENMNDKKEKEPNCDTKKKQKKKPDT